MQEKNIKWITIAFEIHAIRQQLERIITGEIIERATIKCMEAGITLNYEDYLQTSRSNELFEPKLLCQELKEKSINNIINEFDRRFSNRTIIFIRFLRCIKASLTRF